MQDIYQQLQDLCNRQIEKGWKPRGEAAGNGKDLLCEKEGIHRGNGDMIFSNAISYHDLFSAESGFMESVEWKDRAEWIANDRFDLCMYKHYSAMKQMTSTDKIEYVLQNTIQSNG